MIDAVRSSLARAVGPSPGPGILVAVSGGVDSTSLLHVLHALAYQITCIHINHEQRGSASESDAAHVHNFCKYLDIPFLHVRIGDSLAERKPTGSIQSAARDLRYEYLLESAQQRDIHVVVTGHNRDDQAETVLLNLLRKTGIDGLCGMAESRSLQQSDVQLLRPMLHVSRAEIELYAIRNDLRWVEDASNLSLKYTRNRLRHSVLPALQNIDDRTDIVSEIVDMSDSVRLMIDHAFVDVLAGVRIKMDARDPRLPLDALRKLPAVVRSWLFLRAIRMWLPGAPARRTTIRRLEDLLGSTTGKRITFKSGTICREREYLVFLRSPATDRDREVDPLLKIDKLSEDGIDPETLKCCAGGETVLIDGGKTSGALFMRLWQDGDRFLPLGMKGSRKIKAFLTDRKVGTTARRRIRVVCDDEKIVWVVGLQIDDRVRVDPGSTEILRLSIQD